MSATQSVMKGAHVLILCLTWLAAAGDTWVAQDSGVTARLRGLCTVDVQVAWASGSGGTVLRTDDGGTHWRRCGPQGAEKLDFRAIHARDGHTAWVLAIVPGDASRIYKMAAAGVHWDLVHQNRDARVFLDAIAFWGNQTGIAMGDPVQ